MMQTVTELLGESKRRIVYIAYAVIGVALGATQTGFSAAEVGAPLWLVVASAVYLYIGGAFGIVAASNVGAQSLDNDLPIDAEVFADIGGDAEDTELGKHGVYDPTEIDADREFDTEPEIPEFEIVANSR